MKILTIILLLFLFSCEKPEPIQLEEKLEIVYEDNDTTCFK